MSAATKAIGNDAVGDLLAKKGGKKKLMLLAVPLILASVGAGLWLSGVVPHMLGRDHAPKLEAEGKPAVPVFVDLPEMIANLNAKRSSYVKVVARLEVAKSEDAERVKAVMPRIVDLFQSYLREMRPEELRGSAGTHRLREELIARASIAAAPTRVMDVLFSEMIVQ